MGNNKGWDKTFPDTVQTENISQEINTSESNLGNNEGSDKILPDTVQTEKMSQDTNTSESILGNRNGVPETKSQDLIMFMMIQL